MTLIKYDPFTSTREIESIIEDEPFIWSSRVGGSDVDWPTRFLRSFFESSATLITHRHDPLVNIYETEKGWVYMIELPGVKESDTRLEWEDGYLKLSGERKYVIEDEVKSYHVRELNEGKFERYFRLHEGSKTNEIKATFKDGILKIMVPKEKHVRSKLIDIKAE
ncbi:MAG: hypothetical protein A2149_06990 [Candidatus Schekmanbacteria bacterium RBG_16_38_11]|uniref:SHSP domain-containing protein n=2 Tax=Candidatus Schekmaniibacteriota TaxID=1817811 RepID=A0A1F7RAR3_9BACT|nr:MAG: hypothetical protein A2042_04085 [Candidatus Schekmanbacteria bacterium GWA2_38_11]OGL46873.1 MAG: hypothetical protein A2149_06990 [Candidatus Schekmanbacteria bacterium RBG_16_38_11]